MGGRLVIIGGGYVGSEVARRLDRHLDVTLIEPREAFVHVPATIRALVQPGLLEDALLPYDRLLRRGRVLRARADALRPDAVVLSDGRSVAADLMLVATGSAYAAPFKPQDDSIDSFRDVHARTAARIANARRIVIIGAGPVGIELAGEIRAAHPKIAVTLVSADARLMPHYPPQLGRALGAKLAGLGVSLIMGRRAVGQCASAGSPGVVTLDDGGEIEADLVLSATGARGVSTLLSALPGVGGEGNGRVPVDPWLRPSDWPRLFAGGDLIEAGDGMTIVATLRQIPFLARTLRLAATGRPVESLRSYRAWRVAPVLLPLGPAAGSSYLPLPGRFGVMGNLVTRRMKGADLFIPKYRKTFGV